MKSQIRVIGIDDGPFKAKQKKQVLVVGTIYRGGDFMDGLVSCKVIKDGLDSTRKISKMINKCKFKSQLQAIILDGIAVAGFNIINIKELSKKTNLPVIVIIRNFPDYEKFFDAMKKAGKEKYKRIIEQTEKPIKIKNVYVQFINTEIEKVKEILKITSTHSDIPECLRIAHIIASGITTGESRGRA